jgi:hypothetical protein
MFCIATRKSCSFQQTCHSVRFGKRCMVFTNICKHLGSTRRGARKPARPSAMACTCLGFGYFEELHSNFRRHDERSRKVPPASIVPIGVEFWPLEWLPRIVTDATIGFRRLILVHDILTRVLKISPQNTRRYVPEMFDWQYIDQKGKARSLITLTKRTPALPISLPEKRCPRETFDDVVPTMQLRFLLILWRTMHSMVRQEYRPKKY